MKKPILIGFEGNDRCGKDSVIDTVYQKLQDQGINVEKYRNPDYPFRDLLLDSGSDLTAIERFVIFWTGYYNVHQQIISDNPDVALINRHYLSAMVYQNFLNNHIDIRRISQMSQILPLPQLHTIYFLDISEDEFNKRLHNLKSDGSYYEKDKKEMLQRLKDYRVIVEIVKNYSSIINLQLQKEIIKLTNNDSQDFQHNVEVVCRKIKTELNL